MPKIFGRQVPPLIIAATGVLAIALVYTQLFPAPELKRGVSKKTIKKSTGKPDAYQPEDYTIKFVSNSPAPKNTFQPLVVRKSASNGAPGAAPLSFTGGEAGWTYTGMATVNGMSQALLENLKSGDSEFVTKGQSWKSSRVMAIAEDGVILSGPGGVLFTMKIGSDTEPTASTDVTAPNGAPVTVPPGMVGQIGSGDLSVQPMPNGGNGRRRRRNWMNNPGYSGN